MLYLCCVTSLKVRFKVECIIEKQEVYKTKTKRKVVRNFQKKMNSNVVHFKAFLRTDNNLEARRFFIEDPSVVTNYEYMKEKLRMVYPVLRDIIFRVTWKDEDGDEITITSDEDLMTAITEMTKNVKTFYITVLEKAKPCFVDEEADAQVPLGTVVCDGCDNVLKGFRYKCISCPDYDLCSKCEQNSVHAEHIMIRIPPNNDVNLPRCARKFAHHFAKTMKKAHHFASKEAQRASKYATRAHERFAGRDNEEERPGTSRKENNSKPSCPIEENMQTFSNLGQAAVGQFFDIFNPEVSGGVPGGQFAEAIRKALNTFIENAQPAQPQPAGSENNAESAKNQSPDATENQATTQTTNSAQTGGTNHSPMDIENENTDKRGSPKPDNDWTFLNQIINEQNKREKEDPKILEGLKVLLEMGFAHEEYLISILKRFNGNVEAVVKYLLEHDGTPLFPFGLN